MLEARPGTDQPTRWAPDIRAPEGLGVLDELENHREGGGRTADAAADLRAELDGGGGQRDRVLVAGGSSARLGPEGLIEAPNRQVTDANARTVQVLARRLAPPRRHVSPAGRSGLSRTADSTVGPGGCGGADHRGGQGGQPPCRKSSGHVTSPLLGRADGRWHNGCRPVTLDRRAQVGERIGGAAAEAPAACRGSCPGTGRRDGGRDDEGPAPVRAGPPSVSVERLRTRSPSPPSPGRSGWGCPGSTGSARRRCPGSCPSA